MAPFRYGHDDLQHPLDWRLLQNGPVTLYRRRSFLDEDIADLGKLGYSVYRFDCSAWRSFTDMNASFKSELPGFEAYCGDGFDAMSDCLTDLDIPEAAGMAIVFDRFGEHRHDRDVMLDVFADASRRWSLFGRRLLVLVQIDDPDYHSPADLGATPAQWNGREWITADRHAS